LQSLCDRIDAEEFQPLTENDITSPTKRRIFQLRGLIDDFANRLVDSGIISIKGYRATPGPDYYKRYIAFKDFPKNWGKDWCIE
jgi:hypothetical protein